MHCGSVKRAGYQGKASLTCNCLANLFLEISFEGKFALALAAFVHSLVISHEFCFSEILNRILFSVSSVDATYTNICEFLGRMT